MNDEEFGVDEEVTVTFWVYPKSTSSQEETLWVESDVTLVNAYD